MALVDARDYTLPAQGDGVTFFQHQEDVADETETSEETSEETESDADETGTSTESSRPADAWSYSPNPISTTPLRQPGMVVTQPMGTPYQQQQIPLTGSDTASQKVWVVTGSAGASRRNSNGTIKQQMPMLRRLEADGTVTMLTPGRDSAPLSVRSPPITVAPHHSIAHSPNVVKNYYPQPMTYSTSGAPQPTTITASGVRSTSTPPRHAITSPVPVNMTPPFVASTPGMSSYPVVSGAAVPPTSVGMRSVPTSSYQPLSSPFPKSTPTGAHVALSPAQYSTTSGSPAGYPATSSSMPSATVTSQPTPMPMAVAARSASVSVNPFTDSRSAPRTMAGAPPTIQSPPTMYPREFATSPLADLAVLSRSVGADDSTSEAASQLQKMARGFTATTASTAARFSSDTTPWSTKSRWVYACRTGPLQYPDHIQVNHPAFQQGQVPSPFTLYYFDETAPNPVLLTNDVEPTQGARAIKRAMRCDPCSGSPNEKDTHRLQTGASTITFGDSSDRSSVSTVASHTYVSTSSSSSSSSSTSQTTSSSSSPTSQSGGGTSSSAATWTESRRSAGQQPTLSARGTTYSTTMATQPPRHEGGGGCCGPTRQVTAPSRATSAVYRHGTHTSGWQSTVTADHARSYTGSVTAGSASGTSSYTSSADTYRAGNRSASRTTITRTTTAPKATRGGCCGGGRSVSHSRGRTYSTSARGEDYRKLDRQGSSSSSSYTTTTSSTSVHQHQVIERPDAQPYLTLQQPLTSDGSPFDSRIVSPMLQPGTNATQQQLAEIVAKVHPEKETPSYSHQYRAVTTAPVLVTPQTLAPNSSTAFHNIYVSGQQKPHQPHHNRPYTNYTHRAPAVDHSKKSSAKKTNKKRRRSTSSSSTTSSSSSSSSSTARSTSTNTFGQRSRAVSTSQYSSRHVSQQAQLPRQKKEKGCCDCGTTSDDKQYRYRSTTTATKPRRQSSRSKSQSRGRSHSVRSRSVSRSRRPSTRRSTSPAKSWTSASRAPTAHSTKKSAGGCCGGSSEPARDYSFGTQISRGLSEQSRTSKRHTTESHSTTTSSSSSGTDTDRHTSRRSNPPSYRSVTEHEREATVALSSSQQTHSSSYTTTLSGSVTDRGHSYRSGSIRYVTVEEPTGCCGGTRKTQKPLYTSSVTGGSRGVSRRSTAISFAPSDLTQVQDDGCCGRRQQSVDDSGCCGGRRKKQSPKTPAPAYPTTSSRSVSRRGSSVSSVSGLSRSVSQLASKGGRYKTASRSASRYSAVSEPAAGDGCCGGGAKKQLPRDSSVKRYATTSSASSYMFSTGKRQSGAISPSIDENSEVSHGVSGSSTSSTSTSSTSSSVTTSRRTQSNVQSWTGTGRSGTAMSVSDYVRRFSSEASAARDRDACCGGQPEEPDTTYDVKKYFFEADKMRINSRGTQNKMKPQFSTSYKNYPTVCFDVIDPHKPKDFYKSRIVPDFAK